MGDIDAALRARAAAAPVARLATVRPDGRPHLVPVTFAIDGDTVVTAVDHKPKRTTDLRRLRNIAADPSVCLLVDHYEEDWSALWWVRADGTAEVAEDGPRRDLAVRLLRGKYDAYWQQPPQGPAIIVAVERWAGWAAAQG
jgi:PPOX class probable F420-dependent enzyme